MDSHKRRNTIYRLLLGASVFSYALFIVLVCAEGYIRWTLNQNFTFLGGEGSIALALVIFAQTLALAYIYGAER